MQQQHVYNCIQYHYTQNKSIPQLSPMTKPQTQNCHSIYNDQKVHLSIGPLLSPQRQTHLHGGMYVYIMGGGGGGVIMGPLKKITTKNYPTSDIPSFSSLLVSSADYNNIHYTQEKNVIRGSFYNLYNKIS